MLTPSSQSLSLSAHQSVALPVDQQGANPGSSPDGHILTSHRGGKNTAQSHILSWTKEYYWLVCDVVFSERLKWSISAHASLFLSDIALKCVCVCLCLCVCVCVCVCGCPDALLLLFLLLLLHHLLLLFFSLLYTADRALISLVWSSQMEPEHDLFPGETVCFLCPACTKSHIVPLPISHADSPLQVLGYLADGGSDFRSFFFFFFDRQPGI